MREFLEPGRDISARVRFEERKNDSLDFQESPRHEECDFTVQLIGVVRVWSGKSSIGKMMRLWGFFE